MPSLILNKIEHFSKVTKDVALVFTAGLLTDLPAKREASERKKSLCPLSISCWSDRPIPCPPPVEDTVFGEALVSVHKENNDPFV